MCETFKACFEKLEGLTNKELDQSVVELIAVENQNVAVVIAHLAEISRRKADLEHGYRSLFDYGVRRLGLSEGSVALRIQVANVCRRFPQILAALAEGRISLSVAGRLSPHLREDNIETLLADCAGMTKRAVEEYLVRLKPKPVFEPSIRKLHDPNVSTAPAPSPQPAPLRPAAAPANPAPALLAAATPERFNFRFGAAKGFKLKLERLAEVLGIENPTKNMAEVLEKALELALEAKDPQRRLARRLARNQRREEAAEESQSVAAESRPGEVETVKPATSRHVPAAVRDRVFQRGGYQCQFTGPDGTRCTARTGLEIEHKVPFGMRPEHDEPGLEILCAPHNRLRAEQTYGASHVHAKISARRAAGRVERETSGRRCLPVALTESPAGECY